MIPIPELRERLENTIRRGICARINATKKKSRDVTPDELMGAFYNQEIKHHADALESELQSLLAAQLQAAAALRPTERGRASFLNGFRCGVMEMGKAILALTTADAEQALNERIAQAYERVANHFAHLADLRGNLNTNRETVYMQVSNTAMQWATEARKGQG